MNRAGRIRLSVSLAAALLIPAMGSSSLPGVVDATADSSPPKSAFHGFPPSPWHWCGPARRGDSDRSRPPESSLNLYRARELVGAEAVWKALDARGSPLTGKSVTICDLDSEVDIFNPMLFKDDGGSFSWLDVDRSGDLSPGDAVDLNGNGIKDAGETLGWIRSEGITAPDRDTTRFQAGYDFLFQDEDGDGAREYGPPRFGEHNPSYGERLFIVDDADGNERLDPGEKLIGLGTSKIRVVSNGYSEYRRGEDLIESGWDNGQHGTAVCGIMVGGWPGRHRLTGIAPEAEVVVRTDLWLDAGSILWAWKHDADIITDLRKDGGVIDGSGDLEFLVNALSRMGVIFVAATANERRTLQHVSLEGDASRPFVFGGGSYGGPYFVWTGSSTPSVFHLETPFGLIADLPASEGTYQRGHYTVSLFRHETMGGTGMLDFEVREDSRNIDVEGRWLFSFPGSQELVHGYCELSAPSDTVGWLDDDGKYTVEGLGLADSSITVADWDSDLNNDVAWFSGAGPRVDGYPVVDIAAPGIRILAPAAPPDSAHPVAFAPFSGTSASVPFVGGAAALLKQAFPDMDSGLFRTLLAKGAGKDSTTTDRDLWGAGRLDIQGALAAGLEIAARSGARRGLALTVGPNPTAGTSRIAWESSGVLPAQVRVFSVDGRLVWERTVAPSGGRSASVEWNGTDSRGLPAAQGVYFALVIEGSRTGTARIVRLR